ncbi:MAG: hypothetical protein ABSB59_27040 [Streptosporangiaceae bacterium]
MADPFSAAALGGLVLTQGIKFLYQQAGEVLKRWRQRRDHAAEVAEARLNPPEDLLEGTAEPAEPHDDVVDRLAEDLRQTRQLLADYADGIETPQPGDHLLAEQVDALRQLLETVYEQRITFKGEQRPPSGPLVAGQVDVDRVIGDAAAVRARVISGGEVKGDAKAKVVEAGGKLTGVEADQIGPLAAFPATPGVPAPGPMTILDAVTGFVGRRWALDRVERWLDSTASVLVVTGAAGTGKSALAEHLAETISVLRPGSAEAARTGRRGLAAVHVCRPGDDTSRDPAWFVEDVAAQLATSVPGFAAARDEALSTFTTIPVTISARAQAGTVESGGWNVGAIVSLPGLSALELADRLLRRPLGAAALAGPVPIVLVDGLDEALDYPAVATVPDVIQSLMGNTPLRWIVATRPDPRVIDRFPAGIERLDLDADCPPGEDDIATYAAQRLRAPSGIQGDNAELIGRLAQAANGNFLYARWVIDDLMADPERLASVLRSPSAWPLPPGLGGIYREYLTRLVGLAPGNTEISRTDMALLGTLSVARRPMTEAELGRVLALTPAATRPYITRLTRLLVHDGAPLSQRGYRLFHSSFAEFLADGDEARGWWCDPADQHTRITGGLTGSGASPAGSRWDERNDYLVRYGPIHACQAAPPRWAEVLTVTWAHAALERFGSSITIAALSEVAQLHGLDRAVAPVLLASLLSAEVRDYARQLSAQGLPTLLSRANGIDQTLRDLGALPEADWNSSQPLIEIVAELGRRLDQSRWEQVLAGVSAGRQDQVAFYAAAQLAASHPDLALALYQHVSSPADFDAYELCAGLSDHEAYMDDAIRIAGDDARCLYAVARNIGRRDVLQALKVLRRAAPGRLLGNGWRLDDEKLGYGGLAIHLAEEITSVQPEAALNIFEAFAAVYEGRCHVGKVAALSLLDPAAARATALAGNPVDVTECGIGLALIADQDDSAKLAANRRWQEVQDKSDMMGRRYESVSVRDSVAAIGGAPLEWLRERPAGREMAVNVLYRLRDAMATAKGEIRDKAAEAAGTLAAGLAVFDADAAPGLADQAFAALYQQVSTGASRYGPVVHRLAQFDVPAAWRLTEHMAKDPQSGDVSVADARAFVIRAAAAQNPELALRLAGSPGLSSEARGHLAGVLALACPGIEATALLPLLPAFTSSNAARKRKAAVLTGTHAKAAKRASARRLIAQLSAAGQTVTTEHGQFAELIADLPELDRLTAIADAAEAGILQDEIDVIGAMLAFMENRRRQLTGYDWINIWRPVAGRFAALAARHDLDGAVAKAFQLDVIFAIVKICRQPGHILPSADEFLRILVKHGARTDWRAWQLIAEEIVTWLPPSSAPIAPLIAQLSPASRKVVNAVFAIYDDPACAETALRNAEPEVDYEGLLVGMIDFIAQQSIDVALSLCIPDRRRYLEWVLPVLAENDPDRAIELTEQAGGYKHGAFIAVLKAIARTRWRRAAAELPRLSRYDHVNLLETMIRHLPESPGEHRSASDFLIDWLTATPDDYSPILLRPVLDHLEPDPALATAFIRNHFSRQLSSIEDYLDDLVELAATATGSDLFGKVTNALYPDEANLSLPGRPGRWTL